MNALISPQNSRGALPKNGSGACPPLRFCFYLIAAIGLLWVKSPDAILNPQFWAEDGAIFFKQQFGEAWPPLFEPYSGYLHLVPRLVAALGTALDVLYAPAFYNACALFIDAFCIAYATRTFGRYFGDGIVFLSFFLAPTAGDIFGTITNAQWFIQFALFAACLVPADRLRPARSVWIHTGHIGLLLAALSGPFSILISALGGISLVAHGVTKRMDASGSSFLLRYVHWLGEVGQELPRGRLLIVAIGACIQLAAVLVHESATPWQAMQLSLEQQIQLHIALLTSSYIETISFPLSFENIAALLFVLIVLITFFRLEPGASFISGLAILLVAFGVSQPLLAFAKQREGYVLAALGHYFYFITVVAFWLAWQLVRKARLKMKILIGAALAGVWVGSAVARPELFQRPALHDFSWRSYAAEIRQGKRTLVPINPVGWHFIVGPRR